MPTTELSRFLSWWVGHCRRFAWPIVLGALALGGSSVLYTISNIGIDTDTADMIAKDLPWRQTYIAYKEDFPQFVDTLLLVIDADTPDAAEEAAARLADSIREQVDRVEWVRQPGDSAFFRHNALLFLNQDELDAMASKLARVQPFLGTLAREPTLPGLFSLLRKALERERAAGGFELAPVLSALAETVEAGQAGRFHRLSWQQLMQLGGDRGADTRRFVLLKPRLDFGELFPAEAVLDRIRSLTSTLDLVDDYGVRVRITGGPALSHEELASVAHGTNVAFLLAVAMVAAVLLVGLRSLWLLLATLVTLLLGLSWTAAFATLAIGHLNLISVAFAVLYIGLGVDYAIHFCLRCRELHMDGASWGGALDGSAGDVGVALAICALTTGIGFFAFVPTDFTGVSELGIISGTGMFISLVASLTVLPALLELGPRAAPLSGEPGRRLSGSRSWPLRHRKSIRIAAIALALGSLLALPGVRFDDDPLNLRDPNSESVATARELIAEGDRSPWVLSVMAEDASQARALAQDLETLPEVGNVIHLQSFVPAGQEEKLALIDDLGLLLSLESTAAGVNLVSDAESRRESATTLVDALEGFAARSRSPEEQEAARRLAFALAETMAAVDYEDRLASLEQDLMHHLPALLARLEAALKPQQVSLGTIPAEIRRDWTAPDGRWRLEVEPAGDMGDKGNLERFVSAVQSVAPDVTGAPVLHLSSGQAVVRAFRQALLCALLLITALLFLVLRRAVEVGLVLAPLLIAILLTLAVMAIIDLPFNFANVIALPLLLGLGANNGIHMVYRWRAAPPESGDLLKTSTARGVVFSVLTTMCSFGNLAFSAHRGTASMGLLLALGLTLMMFCTLIVTPALQPGKEMPSASST